MCSSVNRKSVRRLRMVFPGSMATVQRGESATAWLRVDTCEFVVCRRKSSKVAKDIMSKDKTLYRDLRSEDFFLYIVLRKA